MASHFFFLSPRLLADNPPSSLSLSPSLSEKMIRFSKTAILSRFKRISEREILPFIASQEGRCFVIFRFFFYSPFISTRSRTRNVEVEKLNFQTGRNK